MESLLNWMGRMAVGLMSKLMLSLDVVEHAELPPGPKIIAANHPSTTDPFVVLGYARKKSKVLIKDVLFDVPVFGPYLHAAGHICVRAGDGQTAFSQALETLERSETVIIFPEGDLSPFEGGFQKPRTGVARLALISGAPIVPVGIGLDRDRIRLIRTVVKGKQEVGAWYLNGPYAITTGPAIRLEGSIEDRDQVIHMAESVMAHIADLAQQSYRRMMARLARVAVSAV